MSAACSPHRAISLLAVALALVGIAAYSGTGLYRASASQATAPRPSKGATRSLYVAQSAAGSGDGSSCANARAVSFFNTAANWGSGKPIAPGTLVGLCGTITSTVSAQGSGVSGSPVTILFTPGARISQPACSPCLNVSNRSFVTVDGGTTGVIEGTNNGSNLGLHQNSTGIDANPCTNCEFKNLTVQNIYVHSGTGSEIDQTQMRSITFSGDNFLFHDNVVHDAGWAIEFGRDREKNVRIYDNDIYRVDHGIVPSFGTAGGSAGPFFIYGNHFHDFANWDTSNNAYHHDGIHCYTVAGGGAHHISDLYIYDNRFDGNIGANATAWIFIEGGSGPGSTPCADSTSNIWVFNNVASLSYDSNNGAFGIFSGIPKLYGNTLVGHGTAAGNVCQVSSAAGAAFQNNICTTANNLIGMSAPAGGWAAGSPDYNVYADGGSNAFVCRDAVGTHFYNFNQFANWRTCIGGDAHSLRLATAGLDAAGVPGAGSRARGAGINLGSLCTGNLTPLCFDIAGSLRPLRMRPDVGAYQAETAAIAPRAVGRARLGASRAAVERFYGPRSAARSRRPLLGLFDIRGALTSTYRIHRGLLDVSYVGGEAVAVSTTSPYYTTPAGFGVGAAASEKKLEGAGWRRCGTSLVRRRAGIATAVHVARGHVVALALSRAANLHCPPAG